MTDVDCVRCAGWMGRLISQMMDLKQNVETCIVPNHKTFQNESYHQRSYASFGKRLYSHLFPNPVQCSVFPIVRLSKMPIAS